MTHNSPGLRGHLKESFAKESFPPKWLLVVAILAVIGGLSWANFRIAAAEAQLTHFAQTVDHACDAKRPVFADSAEACQQAAEKAAGPDTPGVALAPAQGGKEGRGVAKMDCVLQPDGATGRWQVMYTDHVLDPDAGPCFASPPK